MSQTAPNGVITITNDEAYDLSGHLSRMSKSIKSIHSVADQTARDGLAALYGGTLPVPTLVYRIDLDYYEGWNGSVWKRTSSEEATANVSTFSTGWSATAGSQNTPRLIRLGKVVHLVGSVTSSASSGANMLTVPAAFQPTSTGTRIVGVAVTSIGSVASLALTAGVLSIPSGYGNITVTTAQIVPVLCKWIMD